MTEISTKKESLTDVFLVKTETHEVAANLAKFFKDIMENKAHLVKVEDLGGVVEFNSKKGVTENGKEKDLQKEVNRKESPKERTETVQS